jgi:hypothetical protein
LAAPVQEHDRGRDQASRQEELSDLLDGDRAPGGEVAVAGHQFGGSTSDHGQRQRDHGTAEEHPDVDGGTENRRVQW